MFPWIQIHGPIEALTRSRLSTPSLGFRGFKSTAPLKLPRAPAGVGALLWFPWIQIHGPIEAVARHTGAVTTHTVSVDSNPRPH